jgi:propane monooxygenase large subunit
MAATAQNRRRSVTATHERIAQLGWEPTYHEPAVRYPTRYRFPNQAKDPMKQIMREYLPMELEKDERVYGGHDAAVRADMPQKAELRWLEWMKAFIPVTNFAEIAAGRCMSMLMSAVPNNELRNGYHVQFVDEVRHTGMQMSLARWYAKHVPDPAGWNQMPHALANSVAISPGLNMLSHFMVGDPIQAAFTLQVVAETAFTNIVFVAAPDVAARNGDFTLPTTYLSVQSDEARHISNGYATLLTVLQDDHNAPLIERDLQQAFWINHAFIDVFAAIMMEYGSKDRSDPECFIDKWDRWVRDDWYRAYILKLGKLGLNIPPDIFERARERLIKGIHHKHALFAFAAWPLNHWRIDPLDEADFEWFEQHYPGWYAEYGAFHEAYRYGGDRRHGLLLTEFVKMAPPSCWTCQGFCVDAEDRTHRVSGGRTRFYCSQECQWMDESNPGRYTGDRNFFDRYEGWELSQVIRELGYIRADGHTLIGQPHLNQEGMWTIEDIQELDVRIQSPNIRMARELGLPSGDHSGQRTETHPPDGSVQPGESQYDLLTGVALA